MAWKPTGRPTVRRQREKWVVRVDGLDLATGKVRPRQLGTFESRRAAQRAATATDRLDPRRRAAPKVARVRRLFCWAIASAGRFPCGNRTADEVTLVSPGRWDWA